MEKWKRITDFEHMYSISNLGNVKNHRTNKILRPSINTVGYPMVILRKDGKNHGRMIHRLVAIDFLEGRSDLRNEVNHKDANKTNNHYLNLEWVSSSENTVHGYKNKLINSGEKCNFAKLTPEQVIEIKALKGKKTQREIGRIFGVTQSNISCILTEKSWQYETK